MSTDLSRLQALLTAYDPWANRRCLEMLRATPADGRRAMTALSVKTI